ncbi:Protein argonaute 4B [Glycine soja]
MMTTIVKGRQWILLFMNILPNTGIELTSSAYLPCLDVGKPKWPIYLPLELFSLVSLQRYTKVLSPMQRASLVEKSRQKPQDRIRILKSAVGNCYNDDRVLSSCGIFIEKQVSLIEGCVLETPKANVSTVSLALNIICSPYAHSSTLGPWKKKCLSEIGVVTQCIAPVKITDQYLTNVLLKINSKLGGINSLLTIEHSGHLPLIKDTPTMILGIDVSHNSPGRLDSPSIALINTLLMYFLKSILSTDQYLTNVLLKINSKLGGINSLLTIEHSGHLPLIKDIPTMILGMDVSHNLPGRLDSPSIAAAYQHLGEVNVPKFTVIVAQKNHHTKLFLPNGPENVPPGTVVDLITHPRNYDFYMCAHAGMLGTSRPVHYHVLLDEIGFSADGLQNFIHSLSYVNQRSTIATSVVAPICYAHHAAAQMGQLLNLDDLTETGSSPASEGNIPIPELPMLHRNVRSSMFFC